MLLVVTPGWGGLILFAGFGLIGIIGFLWLRSSMKYRSESLWKDREGVDYWAIIEELEEEIESLSLQEELNPFTILSQLQIGFAGLTGGSECMKAASFAVTSIPTLVKTQELGVATREQIRVVLDAALSALRAVRRDDLVATNDALTDFSSSILALKGIPTGV